MIAGAFASVCVLLVAGCGSRQRTERLAHLSMSLSRTQTTPVRQLGDDLNHHTAGHRYRVLRRLGNVDDRRLRTR